MRRKRRLEVACRWQHSVLHAQGIQDSEGDAMNDDDDYSMIDEVMHWMTIIFLALMTITFLAGLAGFIWGMS